MCGKGEGVRKRLREFETEFQFNPQILNFTRRFRTTH